MLERIQTAKILVVGAGGIGCELLKNLVLTGFADIEVRLSQSCAREGERERDLSLSSAPISRDPPPHLLPFLASPLSPLFFTGDRPRHDRCVEPEPPVPLPSPAREPTQGPGGQGGCPGPQPRCEDCSSPRQRQGTRVRNCVL